MKITIHQPTLKLPKGMSVDETQTVVLHISSKESLRDVFYECKLENDSLKGYPETGEYLDCQSWDDGYFVLSIGTEDCEALKARLPSINWSYEFYPVVYSDNNIRINVPCLEKDNHLSLHFALALRKLPDPAKCSTWFAADIRHDLAKSGQQSS